MDRKIKLLIVDDSAVFRSVLARGIGQDPEIQVVSAASDPFDARDKIIQHRPDVMVCDVVMPKMNGIEFIRRLLPQYPLAVVVVSSVSDAVLDAMNAGAVDFVAKPDLADGRTKEMFLSELIAKIKIAANANLPKPRPIAAPKRVARLADTEIGEQKIIAIGASTGGTEAIYHILKCLPENMPGIVIVQHIPPVFSRMFAQRLNNSVALSVKEAEDGDYVRQGQALIAPGDRQMKISKMGSRFRAQVYAGDKVSGHCPSVDVLFHSVATAAGSRGLGVLLTGMGEDGARGLLAMRRRGAYTIGQDQGSSIVYGMPKAAFDLGAVTKQAGLEQIPQAICQALGNCRPGNVPAK